MQSCLEQGMGGGGLQRQQILEVGCGGGLVCEELARRGPDMLGVDPSQAALQTASAHLAQNSDLTDRITYQQSYAQALPYDSGRFHAVGCLDALEHVEDPPAAIAD